MKRILRWTGMALGSLVILAILAYAVAYFVSERILQRTYKVPTSTLVIPTDPASIAEGGRLATIRGCVGGCHGKQGEGIVMVDEPMIGRVVAPNLTAAARKYSAPELVGIIRHGVRPGGRSMLIMPAEAFGLMTDEDLGRTIAFVKSLPPVDGPGPSAALGPLGRIGVAVGQFKTVAELIAATVPPPAAISDEATFGRYLARTNCAQCHGTSLTGDSNPDFTSPSLQVVAAYTPEAFTQLMRTGVPPGGQKLPVMGPTAKQLLSHYTDAEIAALYSYLHTLPAAAPK